MGPVLVCFSQHRSIFPSEENVARRKFLLSAINRGGTVPAKIFNVLLGIKPSQP
jgi:hypothetical protein